MGPLGTDLDRRAGWPVERPLEAEAWGEVANGRGFQLV